jgi:hypothetical protein
MPKYLDRAAEANEVAKELMTYIVAEPDKPKVAELIARLVNLGIRCSPRGVQHTVRLNAVRRAVKDLPVKVSMEQRVDARTSRTYNVLVTQPVGGEASVEAPSDEE